MTQFNADHFKRWFSSIHGFEPFPWQVRLVSEILEAQQKYVVENAAWPGLLDLPTGTGKTSAIDIAVYTQAADPINAPRRIVYVVDRRAIVDQTTNHVEKIRAALVHPETQEQRDVASALASRMANPDGRVPLEVAQLRGGIALDDTWASEPDIPAVLISTVDQVGSRLLFRGYGVSKAMRPIHAGLLGNDCLWLLDEVHLSRPFAQTLSDLHQMREQAIKGGLPVRNGVVQMTATPVGETYGKAFRLDGQLDIEANEVLKQRVTAVKEITLREVKTPAGQSEQNALILAIRSALLTIPGDVIGVIVNRVENAVKLGAALSEDYRVITLTGRMRPIERALIWPKIEQIAGAGRDRDTTATKTILVSTQTIEAGADLDFDGMISEIASLDAIVQRLGRVDRRGTLSKQDNHAKVVLVGLSSQLGKSASDPIYGQTQRETWALLKKHAHKGVLAFDSGFLKQVDKETLEKCVSPDVPVTRLFPHHLDALSQTNPEPATQPVIAYHLHGVTQDRGEVTVIWRGEASLFHQHLERVDHRPEPESVKHVVEQLLSCPPRANEGLTVPLPAFNQWIQTVAKRMSSDDQPNNQVVADVEIVSVADVERNVSAKELEGAVTPVPILRWKGEETSLIDAEDAQPGDVLVIPLEYGGITEGNWDPTGESPVMDIGDLAQWEKSRNNGTTKPTIRVHEQFGWMATGDISEINRGYKVIKYIKRMAIESSILSSEFSSRNLLESQMEELLNGFTKEDDKDFSLSEGEDGQGYKLLVGQSVGTVNLRAKYIFETDGSDVSASLIGVPLTLHQHSIDVSEMAERYAHSLGLKTLSRALATAGLLHDIGKVDRRFQVFLHGGDKIRQAMGSDVPLAKSVNSPKNSQDIVRMRERSGYPKGTRHELLSLALLESYPEVEHIPHLDLIKHLIATHHGWCRALPPWQDEAEALTVSLDLGIFSSEQIPSASDSSVGPYPLKDMTLRAEAHHGLDHIGSGIAERFWLLTRTYGWYGLAWLETILRLADHRQSAWREAVSHGERASQ